MLTFRKQVTKVETERRPWWERWQVKISHVLKSLQQIYHTPNPYWGSVLKIFIHAVHEGAPSTHWWAGIHVASPYSKIPSIHAVPMQRPQSEWVILIWRQSEETTTNIVNKNKMILVDFVSAIKKTLWHYFDLYVLLPLTCCVFWWDSFIWFYSNWQPAVQCNFPFSAGASFLRFMHT